jgi:hypothetical protein
MAMKRVNYYMREEQKTRLDRLKKIISEFRELSISELIRRAVDEFLDRHEPKKKK